MSVSSLHGTHIEQVAYETYFVVALWFPMVPHTPRGFDLYIYFVYFDSSPCL